MYKDYDAYQQEVMQEILEEANEYSSNCQRSEDVSWFYPDGDEE